MGKKIRWGILGPGTIAHKLAESFHGVEDGELYAVGSRSIDRAREFANKFNIPKSYGNYRELTSDPNVEAIYVATPHPFHMENTILSLNSGKAVLCEKPIGINTNQVQKMVNCAKENNVFLMEAMWTRFLPIYYKVEEWIEEGLIGDLRILTADFGYREELDPTSILFDINLGGGALLDVGIYPVSLASLIFKNSPSKIVSMGHLGDTGVDEQSSMILGYDEGQMAILYAAIRTNTKHNSRIMGTKGYIELPSFWNASTAILNIDGQEDKVISIPHDVNGYCYEVREVNRCIKEGILKSPRMPWRESIAIMETLDKIRSQWGLKYPMD